MLPLIPLIAAAIQSIVIAKVKKEVGKKLEEIVKEALIDMLPDDVTDLPDIEYEDIREIIKLIPEIPDLPEGP